MRKISKLHSCAQKAGVGLHAKRIWAEHPFLKEITDNIVSHFDDFCLQDGSIASVDAVLEAVKAYTSAASSTATENPQPNYLAGLIDRLTLHTRHTAYVNNRAWMPLQDCPFSEFSDKSTVIYKSDSKVDLEKIRIGLLRKFVCDKEAIKTITASQTGRKWKKND
jgi:hypothetical protein